jgi:hypothetical protein
MRPHFDPLDLAVRRVYRCTKWVRPMDSSNLTMEQAAQMHKSLFRLANYLSRMVKRMERTGFPPNDPLFKSASRAYDAVCSVCMDLHYLSCKSGVGRPPNENRTNEERTHGRFRGEP